MSRTPFACRVISDDVRQYCKSVGLGEAQIIACVDTALVSHSVEAGKKTADRLLQKQRSREARSSACA